MRALYVDKSRLRSQLRHEERHLCLIITHISKAVKRCQPQTSLSPQRGEGLRVRGDGHASPREANATTFPPLTPALSPLRGEGEPISAAVLSYVSFPCCHVLSERHFLRAFPSCKPSV